MIIEKILKQLTPERAEKEIKAIQEIKLPLELQKWVEKYEKVGKRDEFIWKLFLKIRPEINYISIARIYQRSFQEIKFLIAMFVVLLDDVVDVSQNEKLLNELLKIHFMKSHIKSGKLNKKEKAYLEFTLKVWNRIERLIKKYPRYEEFKNIFRHDINQMVNAMDYDHLINRNHYLINKTEYWLYSPHTMQFIAGVAADLMFLPMSSNHELGAIREIAWEAQKMARIGNWLSTYEREIKNNDFSSGIFAFAIDLKILTPRELININGRKIIKKIKKAKIEDALLKEWMGCYEMIFNLRKKIKIINIQKLLHGLEKLLILELIRKRYK